MKRALMRSTHGEAMRLAAQWKGRADDAGRLSRAVLSEAIRTESEKTEMNAAPQVPGNGAKAEEGQADRHRIVNTPAGAASGSPSAELGRSQFADLAAELERLGREATPGPWAWDQRGEKVNEWALGTAFDANEKPLAGRFEDEDAVYDEYVCSHEEATCNYNDPALICTLRNNLTILVEALRSRSAITESTTVETKAQLRERFEQWFGMTRSLWNDGEDLRLKHQLWTAWQVAHLG